MSLNLYGLKFWIVGEKKKKHNNHNNNNIKTLKYVLKIIKTLLDIVENKG